MKWTYSRFVPRCRRIASNLALLAVALIFHVCALSAQSGGTISGAVIDPSGASIPGVKVTVQNSETGLQQTATTDSDGSYVFPALPSGKYQVEMYHPGFKPWRQIGLNLDANSTLRIDAKLELGPRTETVTVTEAAVHVEDASTQMGEAVSAKEVAAVPLNGRSYTDLLALQPGIVPTSSQQPNAVVMSGVSSTPPSGDLDAGNLSVRGQRETANGFLINGSNVEEGVNMGTAIVPNLDSIQELRVLTSDFDAEYGNYSGGQVIVVTKSGGNHIHGDGFDFLRNTDLDARNYFSSNRASFRQNQFGGSLGGPVRRDRAFFFADYQGTRMTQGVDTGLIAVPSAAARTGDLSSLFQLFERHG